MDPKTLDVVKFTFLAEHLLEVPSPTPSPSLDPLAHLASAAVKQHRRESITKMQESIAAKDLISPLAVPNITYQPHYFYQAKNGVAFWHWATQVLTQKCSNQRDWLTLQISTPQSPVQNGRSVYSVDVLLRWSNWMSQNLQQAPLESTDRSEVLKHISRQLLHVYQMGISPNIVDLLFPNTMDTHPLPRIGEFLSFTVPESDNFHHQIPFSVAHALDTDAMLMMLKMNLVTTLVLAPHVGQDLTWTLLEKHAPHRTPTPPTKLPTPPVTLDTETPDLTGRSASPSSASDEYKQKKQKPRDRQGPRRKYSFQQRRKACLDCHRKKRRCDHQGPGQGAVM
jgi:hypothetical protein